MKLFVRAIRVAAARPRGSSSGGACRRASPGPGGGLRRARLRLGGAGSRAARRWCCERRFPRAFRAVALVIPRELGLTFEVIDVRIGPRSQLRGERATPVAAHAFWGRTPMRSWASMCASRIRRSRSRCATPTRGGVRGHSVGGSSERSYDLAAIAPLAFGPRIRRNLTPGACQRDRVARGLLD